MAELERRHRRVDAATTTDHIGRLNLLGEAGLGTALVASADLAEPMPRSDLAEGQEGRHVHGDQGSDPCAS